MSVHALPQARRVKSLISISVFILSVVACGPNRGGDAARGALQSAVTAEIQEAVEDSVRALIGRNVAAINARDADAVSRLYPDTGQTLSVGEGGIQLVSRDTLRARTAEYFRSLRSITFSQSIERVDVLAPGAAVVAAKIDLTQVDTAGKRSSAHPVWSAAVAQRGGRYVVLQEHASEPPSR